ncbi:Aromatic-L-amino-acid decarboxylase [Artemisia annua]|uniref:Aromatic-L-amino-acid decarboxylase n=1 Tax=Artemisia annua TaxID=35608 RepID=A0A2U1NR78_ARTAN|nr:Aromatic-L-amino-acid decarboxylase [Artemisia annua]
MESVKLATAFTITMIVFMAFTSSGTMAQEFAAAPAPSPSMESAGVALQVPVLLAANIKSNTMNPLEPKELRRLGHMVLDFLADYYQDIKNYSVQSQVNPGFNWELSSPAATELEIVVMEWLLKLLQLPKSLFSSDRGGAVLHGTSEAFVCTLLAAKEKILDQIGRDNTGKLVVYCSDQTHFSFQKSVKIVGINPKNIRHVLTSKSKTSNSTITRRDD